MCTVWSGLPAGWIGPAGGARRPGFALAVVKKFGDDRCSALAAQIAYFASWLCSPCCWC